MFSGHWQLLRAGTGNDSDGGTGNDEELALATTWTGGRLSVQWAQLGAGAGNDLDVGDLSAVGTGKQLGAGTGNDSDVGD